MTAFSISMSHVTTKSYRTVALVGFVFTLLCGTLFHFVYSWSGYSPYLAMFVPVNESVWEHLKLLFFPFLIFMVPEYVIFGKDSTHFFSSKVIAVLSGLVLILFGYYLYTGIVGKHFLMADILLFVAASGLSYVHSYRSLKRERRNRLGEGLSLLLLFVIAGLFYLFTFHPPGIALFQPP